MTTNIEGELRAGSGAYAIEKRGFTKFAVLPVDSDYGRAAIELTKKYLLRVRDNS